MLIALWDEGLSTAEIGRRLDVTKNAVVGKVHRLGLPKRQSPIRSSGSAKTSGAAKPRAERKSTAQLKKAVTPQAPVRRKPAPEPAPVAEIEEVGTVVSLEHLNHGQCSWPIGEPENEDFRFCGHPIVPGRPYCPHHCAKAYVKSTKKAKPRHNEQAA